VPQKLVVGLGNPGPRHAPSRHNAGFRVARRFAERLGIALVEDAFQGRFGRGRLRCGGAGPTLDVAVLLPSTWMNRSGDAVAEATRALDLEPSRDLLLVSDDVDLPFGRIRLRPGGGAGGQRGLAHVIDRLATREIPRLRFGVGRPPEGAATSDHVLEPFSPSEEAALPAILDRAADAIERALCDGVAAAMNAFNADPPPGAEPAASE
jgi:PTH1 family peptidyl-tRNA hydrolase